MLNTVWDVEQVTEPVLNRVERRRRARSARAYMASTGRLNLARASGAPERVIFAELRLQAVLEGACGRCLDDVWDTYRATGEQIEPPDECPGHD